MATRPGGYGPEHPAAGSQPFVGGGVPSNNAMGGGMPSGAFSTYPMQGSYNPGAGYPPAAGGAGYGDSNMSVQGNNYMSDVFFAAACCIVLGSTIGGICLFFNFEVVDWMQMSYLMIFGLILAVLDTPWLRTIKLLMDAKMYISKYLQFVTRVTFRGVTLIFLSSALFLAMWDNLTGAFLMFLAVVLCLFPTLVGMGSVVIGLLKSSKLEKARRQLELVIDQRYDEFAQTYRGAHGGLTMDEFNMMTHNSGGFKFEKLDLKLIFNALSSNPTWRVQMTNSQSQGGYANPNHADEFKLTKQDLVDWCRGGMVFL